MNWLGHENLRFVQTLNNKEKEKCKTSSGLFYILSEKFKPQHNEIMLSLQYFKLAREQNENVEEWIGCLWIKLNESDYKEKDRRLKEQFINGINDDDMMTEIIRELPTIKNTNEITSKQ